MFGFGKKKNRNDHSDPDPALFSDLRRGVVNDVKGKLATGKIPDTDHGLYLLECYLMFDWDSPAVSLYWITEDDYQSKIKSKPKNDAKHFRWNGVEHNGEFICTKELDALWKAFDLNSLDDNVAESAIDKFKGYTQLALLQALADLDQAGAFGKPESRDSLTLVSGGTDNEEIPDEYSHALSVITLNPEAVASRFLRDWMQLVGASGTAANWMSDMKVLINGTRIKASETTFARLVSKLN